LHCINHPLIQEIKHFNQLCVPLVENGILPHMVKNTIKLHEKANTILKYL